MKIEGYKCPNCAGTVSFDSDAQMMKCPYCDSEFEIAALEELQKEIEGYGEPESFGWGAVDTGSGEELAFSDDNDLASGSCPACGAELFGDKNTVAMVCPCCGNAQIVAKRLDGVLKPQYVIPFKLKKDAATEALKNFCKGKRLLPDDYLAEKRINDMQGMYAPFWLFDAHARGHIRYKATTKKTWSDSNYTYIKTNYYSVVRDGTMDFEKIPVDASEKMDDSYMDAMEPFDYSQMTDFHQSYLAGYLAERYDEDADKCKPRAEKRIKGTIETEFRKSVTGYLTVTPESSNVTVANAKAAYSLHPVWVFNTKYQDTNYQFMMNGQTGKLVGRLPVDNGKKWKYGSLFTGIFGIVLSILAWIMAPSIMENYFDVTPSTSTQIEFSVDENGIGDGNVIAVNEVNEDNEDNPYINGQLIGIAIAWLLAVIIATLIIKNWIRQMDTARMQTNATEYAVAGSLNYSTKSDRFMYSRTTRIPKPKPPQNRRK